MRRDDVGVSCVSCPLGGLWPSMMGMSASLLLGGWLSCGWPSWVPGCGSLWGVYGVGAVRGFGFGGVIRWGAGLRWVFFPLGSVGGFWGVSSARAARSGAFWGILGGGGLARCAGGSSVKDHPRVDVQLESLILAQNERWRQA